jgi:uncharacterized protein|tara:strand:- start:19736 stop:20215 length:480 start_codon:yes stop_codon:yes gene_type:complete
MHEKIVRETRAAAADHFSMSLDGIHGLCHWDRVHENGVFLARYSGGDLLVVELFAYLHDSCRQSDSWDPEHGLRAAELTRSLAEEWLNLEGDQLELLVFACEFHEKGKISDDPTVGACWDSDRLDLGRVGIKPDPKLLSTERAKHPEVINWGWQRSLGV